MQLIFIPAHKLSFTAPKVKRAGTKIMLVSQFVTQ